ncbi:MAG: LysM peptidoglycan-binding domain-containing protein [Solirubrobacteraceae bacterium]
MRSRSLARWLAPLALLGSIAAIMLVVQSSDTGSKADTGTNTGITGSTASDDDKTSTTTTTSDSGSGRRFYTVKDGDVLSAIADKTGVPLEDIETLNPTVDAQTLHAGQRIKLRP